MNKSNRLWFESLFSLLKFLIFEDGSRVTKILGKCNLSLQSFNFMFDYCYANGVIDFRMTKVSRVKNEQKIYFVTDKGLLFFKKLSSMIELYDDIKLVRVGGKIK